MNTEDLDDFQFLSLCPEAKTANEPHYKTGECNEILISVNSVIHEIRSP